MDSLSPSVIIRSLVFDGREDAALDMCISLGVDSPDTFCEVLDILDSRGDVSRLLTLSETAARQYPNHPGIAARRVNALLASCDPSSAAEAAEAFMECSGDHRLWAMRAECLMRAGQPAEAGNMLRRYMPANPGHAGAWLIAARLLHAFPDDSVAGILSALEYEISVLETEIDINGGRMQFARALMREVLGDHEGAAGAFVRGNEILDAIAMSEDIEETCLAGEIRSRMGRDWIAGRSLKPVAGLRPVFLLGSPLTGLDAVRRMLAAGTGIRDAGEPRMLDRDLFFRLGAPCGRSYGEGLATLEKEDLQVLRDRYLGALPRNVGGDGMFVDAMPSNIRHAGVLQAMFPDAAFVICDRDADRETIEIFRTPLDVRAYRLSAEITKIRSMVAARRVLSDHWAEILGAAAVRIEFGDTDLRALQDLLPDWAPGLPERQTVPGWPETPEGALPVYAAWL